MIGRPRVRASVALAIGALLIAPGAAAAQDAQGSRVETVQIGDQLERRRIDEAAGKAYIGAPRPATPRRGETASEQVAQPDTQRETVQISTGTRNSPGMAQLSAAELEAQLAQLTPNERRVLLDAIQGTDICDNPPDIAAIRALCRNRIETRSSEFADTPAAQAISAEERLLRGDLDETGTPNVEQVIKRLARASAAADDLDNQAIASIALAPPSGPPATDEDRDALGNLPPGTEAVINAIVNQLGGNAGGP